MREREIFIEALARDDPHERAEFLDQACQGDAELRLSLERLLTAHQRPDQFILDQPAPGLDVATGDALREQPGTVIGPYKLLQQIGEGGMGVVFMAQQTRPIERTVAIKIIKSGMDTRQVIARFQAERQAVALMDHPNIAKVLDAGATENGRPYFVMELVKGVPLTTFCDQKQLSLRARLDLFVQVCHAVQHAHQRGIIHRDIKPTNVLVAEYDDLPVPKMIDFGVAKATLRRISDGTLFTELGQMVGTLEYMSPEQAKLNQLDVDTRSDIYSLGVLLYELLTGSTPFRTMRLQTAAFDEMLRIVREEEPLKPSTSLSKINQLPTIAANRGLEPKKLSGILRGELDWIVMKALEKNRNRRYETANSLAVDVERYLANQPVEACPPSALYRLRKIASRNKLAIATATMIATSLVVGTVVSVWQATRARQAEAQSQLRLLSERAALQRAKAETIKATTISTLLQQMLNFASPTAAKETDYTVRQMLADFSTGLGDQLRDQPEVEAAIRATIGNAYRRLQSFEQAEPQLKSALELRVGLFGPEHPDVAQSLVDYSANLYGRGDVVGAESHARQALAIHRKLPLPDRVAMQILSTLQLYLVVQDKFDEATQIAQEALRIAGRRPAHYPEEANVLHHLAHGVLRQGDARQAEQFAQQSVELHRKLHGDQHPETAHGLFVLASVLHDGQKYAEAETHFRATLAIQRRYFNDAQTPVLAVLAGLAQTLRAKGDQAGLQTLFSTADLTATYPEEWESWYFRGSFLAELGRWQQADEAFVKAAERDSDPRLMRCRYYSALVRLAANDLDGYRDACAVLVTNVERSAPARPPFSVVWACVLAPHSVDDSAQVVAFARRLRDPQSTDPGYLATLGAALYRDGQFAEARSRFTEAIAATSPATNDLRSLTYSRLFLALIDQQLGERQPARQWLEQAAQSLDQRPSPGQRNLADSWDSILPLQLLRQEAERALAESQ